MAGCPRASNIDRFPPNDEEIAVVQTVPAPGTTEVPPDVRIDLCWSGLVDPRSVSDVDATISSGNAVVDADLQVQLFPWRGPGGTDLPPNTESPWCSGSVLSITPQAPLPGGVLHRLRLRPTLVGWEGQQIDTETQGWLENEAGELAYLLEFEVRLEDDDDGGEPEPDPTGPNLRSLFEAGRIFDPQRGACSCHAGADPDAQALLDLSDPLAALEDLVVPGRTRDTGFPMVTARRPSESFLLHKLLQRPDGGAIRGVLGDAMPQDGAPIPYLDLVEIAEWIEAGAEL